MPQSKSSKTFDELSPNGKWQVLLEQELQSRNLLDEKWRAGKSSTPDRYRAWWGDVESVLKELSNRLKAHSVPEQLPIALLETLCGLAGYLKVGTIPRPMTSVVSKGNKGVGPTERKHISLAVAYKHAASKDGLVYGGGHMKIDDRKSTLTICNWYGVKSPTVTKWVRQYPSASLEGSEIPAEKFINAVKSAGKIYRRHGRSASALIHRGSKRTNRT